MIKTESDFDGACDLQLVAVELADDNKFLDSKHAQPRKEKNSHNLENRRLHKRLMLLTTKPSYSLKLGEKNARQENRIKLRYLLGKLVRQQNWVEASGVLSTLLKGTCKERSLLNNRMKYWAAMELLRHVFTDADVYTKEIKNLYRTWMGKIHSWKNKPLKDKCAKLESILSVLAHSVTRTRSLVPAASGLLGSQESLGFTTDELTLSKTLNDAREDARSLKLEKESASDPTTNLVIGLTFYEDWYSTIPKEMQLKNLDEMCLPMESETRGYNSCEEVKDMRWDDAASIYETHSNSHCYSETSVVNDKDANCNTSLQVVPHRQFRTQGFYANSIDTNTDDDVLVNGHYDKMQFSSVFNVRGLQSFLPIRFPSSEDMPNLLSSYERSFDGIYKNALEHLQLAFESPPPVSEAALLPLIQLLLLGNQTKEAFLVLEKSCKDSSSMFPSRLRAHLWECFHANDTHKLANYLEDVLKKDPTCRSSLSRLLSLHQKGDYATEQLVEMIALHLEATFPDHNIWKEFASCLLKLSWCVDDRQSMCVDKDEADSKLSNGGCFRSIPDVFVKGISGKTWKLRCKWWLDRHFRRDILESEMSAGDLQVMAYKASCASHIYGKELEYVVKVDKHVSEHNYTLMTSLHLNMKHSMGLYSYLVRRRKPL